MLKRVVTIRELRDGRWLWAEHGRTFDSLSKAIKADDKDAKLVAGTDSVVITVRIIVKA